MKKPEKNPAAVALGRLGGLKGGKARAKKLSKKRKVQIARKGGKAKAKKWLANDKILLGIKLSAEDVTK